MKKCPKTPRRRDGIVIALSFLAGSAQAFDAEVSAQRAADAFLLVRPLATMHVPNDEAALQVQERLVTKLMPFLGEVIGYKAALTNPEVQQHLGLQRPITGVLHRAMLLPEGVPIPVRTGVQLFAEADLLVRVGDARINEANNDLELLHYVDAFATFVEIPDLLFHESVRVDGAMLAAVNAGARYGVAGPAFSVVPTRGAMELLGNMQVALENGAGQVLGTGRGSDLLGNPVTALRWLRDALLARGTRLKPGDLLSLGSLTTPVPVQAGERYTARYKGLFKDQDIAVSVSFE